MAKFKIQYYIDRNIKLIENPLLKYFSLFAKFYMMICPKMAPKPYIETLISKISKHRYWNSSYRNPSYRKYQTCKPYWTFESQIPYRTSTKQWYKFLKNSLICKKNWQKYVTYIRGHSRNQQKGGRNFRNVTLRHAFLTIFSVYTLKESRSLFKGFYLLYFVQNFALDWFKDIK